MESTAAVKCKFHNLIEKWDRAIYKYKIMNNFTELVTADYSTKLRRIIVLKLKSLLTNLDLEQLKLLNGLVTESGLDFSSQQNHFIRCIVNSVVDSINNDNQYQSQMDVCTKVTQHTDQLMSSCHCSFRLHGRSIPVSLQRLRLSSSLLVLMICHNHHQQQPQSPPLFCLFADPHISPGQLYLLNRDSRIFVSSSSDDLGQLGQPPVEALGPGRCICVLRLPANATSVSPVAKSQNRPLPDLVCIQVSLGKGWGPGYRRQSFLQCPRRCEVTFQLPH